MSNSRRTKIAELEAQITALRKELAPLERAERDDVQKHGEGRCFSWTNGSDLHLLAITGGTFSDEGCPYMEGVEVAASDYYDGWSFQIGRGTAFDRMPSNAVEITQAEFDRLVGLHLGNAMRRAADMRASAQSPKISPEPT